MNQEKLLEVIRKNYGTRPFSISELAATCYPTFSSDHDTHNHHRSMVYARLTALVRWGFVAKLEERKCVRSQRVEYILTTRRRDSISSKKGAKRPRT